ncbi:WXG100 family type VII secretion target [Streptomyces sp. A5-4]|uniref:WXG100 family type VII secretion target n=1 Tax=Streptomyces sp. A5-4 TaxID=3384771 RepID=UPI003DAA1BF6
MNAKPQPKSTNFQSMSHEKLVAMLTAANPAGPANLARKLAGAATTISKIGEDLKTHVAALPWHGEGGDAFRQWGNQAANATLHLGEYSEVASRWMEQVSTAVAEAKATMPALAETTKAKGDLLSAQKNYKAATDPENRNDPDARTVAKSSQADATAAQGRMDAARQEAVQRLTKLAQAYELSAHQVNSVQPPTFPPPARYMGADEWEPKYQSSPDSTAGGSATLAGRRADPTPRGGADAFGQSPQPVRGVHHAELGTTPATAALPDRSVGTEIDGVGTLPQAPSGASTTLPSNVPTTGRPDGGMVPPVGLNPPVSSGRTPTDSAPVSARRQSSGARAPMLPGQGTSAAAGSAGRSPGNGGIVGGRPTPSTNRTPGGIPRGTVVGGEGAYGRGPMGSGSGGTGTGGAARGPMGAGTGAGAGGAGTGQRGSAVGRRLASETGGIVGGRPNQSSRAGTRPFTPGGTGLVRGAAPGSAPQATGPAGRGGAAVPPPSSRTRRKPRDEEGNDRPDYLVEDEETWQRNNRRAGPPVID